MSVKKKKGKVKKVKAEKVVEELTEKDVEGTNEECSVEDELRAELKVAENTANDNWEQYLLARADLENMRRRAQQDIENAHKYGTDKLLSELLPVVDSLELGLIADATNPENMREGIELTINMVNNLLEKLGVKDINPVNEKFDPEFHQAMTMQPTDEVEPNTVITVMQKGYVLNDRLLRPAMVVVSKAVEK